MEGIIGVVSLNSFLLDSGVDIVVDGGLNWYSSQQFTPFHADTHNIQTFSQCQAFKLQSLFLLLISILGHFDATPKGSKSSHSYQSTQK